MKKFTLLLFCVIILFTFLEAQTVSCTYKNVEGCTPIQNVRGVNTVCNAKNCSKSEPDHNYIVDCVQYQCSVFTYRWSGTVEDVGCSFICDCH